MRSVIRDRSLALPMAAMLLIAASVITTATFSAPGPGSDLAPVGNADRIVEILQGNRTVLWSPLSGSVSSYRVDGWPVTVDGNELGGALLIERPGNETAGVVDFGEKPMSLSF